MTSHLAELISKRTGATGVVTEQARILIDVDRHRELRPQWEDVTSGADRVERRIRALEANPEFAKVRRKKMNSPDVDPLEADRAELEALHAKADELRDQLQECFVVVTVRGLRTDEVAKIRSQHSDDSIAMKNAQLRAALVSVTDVHGKEIDTVTTSTIADVIINSPYGLEGVVWDAINRASASVDFPT